MTTKTDKMKKQVFTRQSRIAAPVEELFKWHARPGALERLTPPWESALVLQRKGGIETGSSATVRVKAGPFAVTWKAEHFDYEQNKHFRDRQVSGPFASWVHTHRFKADGENASILDDHIVYALPMGLPGNLFGAGMVARKLSRSFRYRHDVTAADLADHLSYKGDPLTIAISGASGLIGTELIPFLSTGGHRILRLVRRKGIPEKGEVSWNPFRDHLDPQDLAGTRAFVHLSGENIGQGRWTPEKKKRIIESRNRSTELIARTAASMNPPPEVIVCASAIGYYGDRDEDILTEESTCGADFISGVCSQWEDAALPAIDKGIRVVFLRIGVVLSPIGGALQRLLTPFAFGIGGKIASGRQYMSWITIDDVLGIIHRAITDSTLHGPVNVVAPNPVSNQEFTDTLGKVLRRPTFFSIPETVIRLVFGEMGKEVLLSSTRVHPEKLVDSGYSFRHPDLEGAVRHLLGRYPETV